MRNVAVHGNFRPSVTICLNQAAQGPFSPITVSSPPGPWNKNTFHPKGLFFFFFFFWFGREDLFSSRRAVICRQHGKKQWSKSSMGHACTYPRAYIFILYCTVPVYITTVKMPGNNNMRGNKATSVWGAFPRSALRPPTKPAHAQKQEREKKKKAQAHTYVRLQRPLRTHSRWHFPSIDTCIAMSDGKYDLRTGDRCCKVDRTDPYRRVALGRLLLPLCVLYCLYGHYILYIGSAVLVRTRIDFPIVPKRSSGFFSFSY